MADSDTLTSGIAKPNVSIDINDPHVQAFLSHVASAAGIGGNSGGAPAAIGGNAAPMPQTSGGVTASTAPVGDVRSAVAQQWRNAGFPEPAVAGIMRRINVESGFNPRAVGDNGTSFGLYQNHGDRAARLAQWAQANGQNPADPIVQTKFAIHEINGGDPIAARAKSSLQSATDPNQAYGIFTASYERPAGAPGSEETNLHSLAHGSFTGPAQEILSQWQSGMARRSQQFDAAMADSHDLRDASRAALQRWENESDRPPQNMHSAWSQWAGIAGVLAAVGGLLGGRSMTASLTAAGSLLNAANAADVQTYDVSYAAWKSHLDNGLKLVGLLNDEAKDIADDARKSYDQKLTELQTLSSVYQLQERLDPSSVANMTKNLQMMKDRQEIIEAQNTETETRNAVSEKDDTWLQSHPDAGGTVPADVHLQHVGAAKRERSGLGGGVRGNAVEVEVTDPKGSTKTQLAQQMPNGQWVTADENRTPIEGVTRVVKEGQASGRESTMIQRQLVDAKDAVSEIGNIASLPVGASSGMFGGYEPGTSLFGATRAVLARTVTSQEVQDYNASAVGLGRALAGLETGGMQVNASLMNRFEELQLKEGDTNFTKMRKLALMRQQADNALEAALANPRMGRAQIDLAHGLLSELSKQIPWTVPDVTKLEQSRDPKATLSDFATGVGLRGLPPGVPQGSQKVGTKNGNPVYQAPDGSRYMVH